MAARLMRHWYRLYRISSPLCIEAGQLARTGGSSCTFFASMTTCNLSREMDKLSVKELEKKTLPDHSRLEYLIATSSSVEDLLRLKELFPINGNKAALIITQLSHLVAKEKLDHGVILQDQRFQQLLYRTYKEVSWISQMLLVNLLKSLYFLRVDRHQKELLSAEQEVRWRMKSLPYKSLASLAAHMAVYSSKDEQSELLRDLVTQLELRWTEIEDARTIVLLMTKVGSLSPRLMERLEDKGLELAAHFSPEDIQKISLALAQQNCRSLPLFRAISYHLVQKHFAISPDILLDVAFAFGKLNFHQTQVFQKISSDLLPHIPQLGPADVVRCSKSFSFLKWLNLPLFEALAEYTFNNSIRFTQMQLVNVILAFARLNFHPSNKDEFYSTVLGALSNHVDSLDPWVLVDLVWSLCVLQQVEDSHLQRVLVPEFYSRFFGNWSPKKQSYWLKLMHINATAQLECTDYKGPFLPPEKLNLQELRLPRSTTPLQSELKETLREIAGGEAHVCYDVDTIYGWKLDAEMVLDEENNPLPVANLDPLSWAKAPEAFQPRVRRLAFLAWQFPNFSSRSKDLLGRFIMARRHIQASGLVVVEVPYYEWFDLNSEWKKTHYLKDKMQKAVAKFLAE